MRRPGCRRQGGQSILELAIATPVLLVLMMGAFNVGALVIDKAVAGYATWAGARLAGELGPGVNGQTQSQVDQQVVQNVLASSTNLSYATISEIDVYSPTGADGSLNPATDQYDAFDGHGNSVSWGFPFSSRQQVPPDETSIGVRILWRYTPPTAGYSFTMQLSEYSVVKVAPVLPT